MQYILIGTGCTPFSLCLVDDEIAENLTDYGVNFCEWTHNGPKADILRKNGFCYEKEFIEYLNTIAAVNCPPARFIRTLEDYDIPKQYKELPRFIF